jgi:hypothetical protein
MSSLFDKAKGLWKDNAGKAKDLVRDNADKVDDAVDKVAGVVDEQTKRKHTAKITGGAAKAKDALAKFAGDGDAEAAADGDDAPPRDRPGPDATGASPDS